MGVGMLATLGQHLPSMSALKAFDSAARNKSIRKAAAELAVSHTVVSRHLRKLETVTAVKLLHVGSRGVTLTPEGARYHAVIANALRMIARGTAELRPTIAHGEVRIWCAEGLATRWLMRRLPNLERILAPVEIALTPSDQLPNFSRGEADLAISYGVAPDCGSTSDLLAHLRFFPVVSPEYLRRRGPIDTLARLAAESLLHEDSKEQWRRWFEAAGLEDLPRLTGPRLRFAGVAIEAAIQGQGVALANMLLVKDEIRDGRLIECLSSDIRLDPYLIHISSDRRDDGALRRLRNWLSAEIRQ